MDNHQNSPAGTNIQINELGISQLQESNQSAPDVGFDSLVNKNLDTELAAKLSSSLVGGYSKKSVEDFIAEMRNNLHQVKVQLEQQIHDLAAEKASVFQECSLLREQLRTAEENLIEERNHILTQGDFEQELQASQDEIKRLRSMLTDDKNEAELKQHYENLLSQKENEISRLTETLNQNQHTYDVLNQKTQSLEISLRDSSLRPSDLEIEELKRQKKEIEVQYQTLTQQMKETEKELAQKDYCLAELQVQLEQEQAQLLDLKKELEDQKNEYTQMKNRFEQERESFAATHSKVDQNNKNVAEVQAHLEGLLTEKDRQLETIQKQFGEQQKCSHDLEKKVDSLYQNYTQGMKKIQQLEQVIAEKELLLQHYQKQEQESILMRQENEQAKNIIVSLKETIHKIMQQMDVQSEGLNQYVTRTIKERETLNASISEQATLRLRNVELINQLNKQEVILDEVKVENNILLEEIEQLKAHCNDLEQDKKIMNLDLYAEEQKPKLALADPELHSCHEAYEKAQVLLQKLESKVSLQPAGEESYWLDDIDRKENKTSSN